MYTLPLAFIGIFGFILYFLMHAWSTDAMVRRAHELLQSAKKDAAAAGELLAECCAECEKAIARHPRHRFALQIRGAALWLRAKQAPPADADRLFIQAEEMYVAALEIKPDDIQLTLDLFWVRWDRAHLHTGPVAFDLLGQICDECERLLILFPREAPLLNFWGSALEAMGNRAADQEAERLYRLASEKYAEALAVRPGDAAVMNSLASVFWRRARRHRGEEARALLAESSRWLELALAADSKDVRALSLSAWVLFSRTRLAPGEETDRLLADAARLYATFDDPNLRQASGLVLWGQGRLEDARLKLTDAEQHQPGSAAYNLACVCAQLGDEAACRDWLERSREPGVLVSREQMSVEEELAQVRHLPWFRELVA
jgi:tetratricopeptide (TPR) repeat protein